LPQTPRLRGGRNKSVSNEFLFVSGGKTADLMTAYNAAAKIAVFDMARCNSPEWFPWNFIENLKNGWFTTTKYHGRMRCFTPPKVVVFMNQDPPRNKLSMDRYDVKYI